MTIAAIIIIPVVVALITAGPSWLSIQRFRSENRDQHADNYTLLQSIDSRLQTVSTDVGDLKTWKTGHEAHHRESGP